jgi:hypothetical protein
MAFRPNYSQQRGDRDRAKEQKKKERLERREEDARKRKSGLTDNAAEAAPAGAVEDK